MIRTGVLTNTSFRLLAVSVLLTSVGFCQSTQETTNLQDQKFEANLTSGTSLRLRLHDGNYRVVGGDSEKISVRVEGKNAELAKQIKIRLKRSDGSSI